MSVNAACNHPPATVRVLGLDPGLADVGWGVIDYHPKWPRPQLVEYGIVQTTDRLPLPERLLIIHEALAELVARLEPTVVAVEQLFFSRNVKTAMAVAHGRAACILATAPTRQMVEYTPPQIKKALTGNGNAAKLQVQMMVRAVLGLKEIPSPDHAADALGAALCYVQSLGLDGRVERAVLKAGREEAAAELNPRKVLLGLQRRRSRRRR